MRQEGDNGCIACEARQRVAVVGRGVGGDGRDEEGELGAERKMLAIRREDGSWKRKGREKDGSRRSKREDSFSQSDSAWLQSCSTVSSCKFYDGGISEGGSRLRRSTRLLCCSPSPFGHAYTHVCVRYAGNIKYGVEQRKGERNNSEKGRGRGRTNVPPETMSPWLGKRWHSFRKLCASISSYRRPRTCAPANSLRISLQDYILIRSLASSARVWYSEFENRLDSAVSFSRSWSDLITRRKLRRGLVSEGRTKAHRKSIADNRKANVFSLF
jgi:hypothetical protein